MEKLRENVTLQSVDTGPRLSGPNLTGNMSRAGAMRFKLAIALGMAVLCAGAAAYMSNAWFQSQFARFQDMAKQPETVPAQTVIVAAKELEYGVALTPAMLKPIPWPADEIPQGAFMTTKDLLAKGSRAVLTPMARNEPILSTKVTKPGEPASLSAMLEDGHKAVTIRVDDVLGVAGLIKPGDRVDVLWTRTEGSSRRKNYTEVLLQNVKVLAIDQKVDEGNKKSGKTTGYAKAVTIEVGTLQSQKVALATSVGKLYLTLRDVGQEARESTRRVTLSDLGIRVRSSKRKPATAGNVAPVTAGAAGTGAKERPVASSATNDKPGVLVVTDDYVVVGVTRGLERSEYNVKEAVQAD
ncbi:MAG: Flp pilus assembly protein CpaB [Hyphomicrobiales bacterium]